MGNGTCTFGGCSKPVLARGYCARCYERLRVSGELVKLPPKNRKCSVDGCESPHDSRGYCRSHLGKLVRTGTTNGVAMDLPSRVWRKVAKGGPGECWQWVGAKNHLGYGSIHIDRDTGRRMAHRVVYELIKGAIPEWSTDLDHLCRTPSCVNPDHLEPVTHRENMLRAPWTAIQFQAAKTHCPHGHEYTDENTYRKRNGARECRTCRTERARRWREAQRLNVA